MLWTSGYVHQMALAGPLRCYLGGLSPPGQVAIWPSQAMCVRVTVFPFRLGIAVLWEYPVKKVMMPQHLYLHATLVFPVFSGAVGVLYCGIMTFGALWLAIAEQVLSLRMSLGQSEPLPTHLEVGFAAFVPLPQTLLRSGKPDVQIIATVFA
jgi:hypothetical protein